ncbi:MAG: hypothetical protein J5965_15735 [Aeriscardovia sp.]|nr:hypothetical protein [Aeriscardovia sp.]
MEREFSNSVLPRLLLHIAIIETLIFSGSKYIEEVYFGKLSNELIVFFVTNLFLFISTRREQGKLKGANNIRRLIFIVIWIISVTFILGQGNHDFTFLSYLLFGTGTFLLISSTNFLTFRNFLLKYLIIISVVSIIVQLGHDYLGFFPSKPFIEKNGSVHLYSYMFNTEWGGNQESNRLSSIYWEPGQYQIVIFYVLALFADEWSVISNWKNSIKKFWILIVSLLLTISTTAYLMLMLVVLIIFVKSGRMYFKFIPLLLLVGGGLIFALFNSKAVQMKVDQRENDNVQSSYTIRLADNIGCLMVTMEDPLTGYGTGSDLLNGRLLSQGSISSSNGWLYGSAQLGIPYIIFLWICMWGNLKKLFPRVSTSLLFLLLVLSQSNESCISFPYLFFYVFSFTKYENTYIQRNI